jgi:hypothetical protein
MPTISQLPSADIVSASDLIPISQGGSVHSISVGALLAQTQPAIIVGPPSLLGRFSIGPGGPDTIALGDGLALNSGTLTSSSFNLGSLPLQTNLDPDDQIVVTNDGTSQLVGLNLVRELFSAGPNITIDSNGVISGSALGGGGTYSLAALTSVTAIASGDLVGVNLGGQDHTITYSNLLDGLTIDLAPSAALASDSDTFWVAQTSNTMLRQTLSALWPWISGKLPSWQRPVIELSVNTSLVGTLHNNAILVCSNPILISAVTANMGSGFSCELINASSGPVTFSTNVLTSNGSNGLSSYQCGSIRCVTYSVGTVVFASISAGSSATVAPGQATGLTTSSVTSTSVTVSWSVPTSGGAVSVYSILYRITGTTPWLLGGQSNSSLSFMIIGLQPASSYDFAINTTNNIGTGPISPTLTAGTLAAAALPGAPTGVTVSNITANSMTCSWTAPVIGGTGLVYGVQYRVAGQSSWNSAATNLSATTTSITNLTPSTSYNIQVTASASNGSGPPSTVVTAGTVQLVGLVTSIIWNLAPTGTFAHGSGAIGVNVHVTPQTAPVQFGFSTSPTTPPTSWVAGSYVNSDLWGQYVSTPATVGSWYAWAEGTDGSAPTVYPTPFTVT